MIPNSLRYKDSFILNGDFEDDLQEWHYVRRVIRATDLWQGSVTPYMHAFDGGEASQTVMLAEYPRPNGKAVYELRFWYEAYGRENARVRITTGLGAERYLTLVPSLPAGSRQSSDPDAPRRLNLTEYPHQLELDPEDESVTITFISALDAENDDRGLRVTFIRMELLLEPLRLQGLIIDDRPQPFDEPLHLCFGAWDSNAHEVSLSLAEDSAWQHTKAAFLVEEGSSGPDLSSRPSWKFEQTIESAWRIGCDAIEEDAQYSHRLFVRSQYTADLYDVQAVSGHFRLDVVALLEATYYPVIDLAQSVELRVQVKSHYMPLPLANREVTWVLTSSDETASVVLFKQLSDENGEASYTYTPVQSGEFQITASVDSYYQKDEAKHVFTVRALQNDPWQQATFSLDDSPSSPIWGAGLAYPCRGASHQVTITFPPDHALAGTDLALGWQGEYTPGGLGVVISPELDDMTSIGQTGLTWSMVFGSLRDTTFDLYVKCSRLLEASPCQSMRLAHNWVAINDSRQSTRFPVVDGPSLRLSVQVRSMVPNVGTVPGVAVQWSIDGEPPEQRPTGSNGWSDYFFEPVDEGTFTVTADVESPYKNDHGQHDFTVVVLGESPWQSLAAVTLNGTEAGSVGLVCFLGDEPAELRVSLVGDSLENEEIYLRITDEHDDLDLDFESEPPLELKRKLLPQGLAWAIRSNDTVSSRFLLHVYHDELPTLVLPGLLLSRQIDEEGGVEFDERNIPAGAIAYPCIGAIHSLFFIPKAHSPLVDLEVAASWTRDTLPIALEPEPGITQELGAEGAQWCLDCRASNESGESALSLEFPQIDLTYSAVNLSLGHNRVEMVQFAGPNGDPFVGESVWLEVKVGSFYTKAPLGGIQVAFNHGEVSTPVPTQDTGWAKFSFTAEVIGEARVIATVPSPYDGPEEAPSHEFIVTVLGR